ncbi:MAG TPA: hypothetical protein VJ204_16985 [Solirubrobacterales bacterium]|nr:hypothetical protein [Solirubrobacterales bacterium]
MRDFLLNETLRRLATEAATRLNAMVAEGEEIPFDVATDTAEDSPFYSYVPQTGRYVAERAVVLHGLPSWSTAREAVVEAGVASTYLESRGEVVPPEPGARAERLLEVFIVELFDGGSGFALDRELLEELVATLDAETRSADDADVLIVPIVGLRMSMARLQLPNGVRIVQADSIEVPIEAMRSEGMGRAAWEPQFLAVAEQGTDGAEAALEQLRELISVMRMFKTGGIGLAPFAFAPTGSDTWRRITTGAPATRPGGYRLTEEEGGRLADFAALLEQRPDPDGALTWAVGRFEMGCERESAMEGLSDHLLALRAVLEGHGPVGASLPMRASALIADDNYDRIAARERMEEVLELERALMHGSTLDRAIDLATWIEDGARRLLRKAALGELGPDLSTIADETLISTGLDAGDAEITVFAQDDFPDVEATFADEEEDDSTSFAVIERTPAEEFKVVEFPVAESSPGTPGREAEDVPVDGEEGQIFDGLADDIREAELYLGDEPQLEHEDEDTDTRIMEPIPAPGEIKVTATAWLDEVSEEQRGNSLEWPAQEDRDLQHRERIDTPRVRHLFPVPDANWDLSHPEFDYKRH